MRFVSKILLSLLPVFAMAAASANDFPSIEVNGLFGNQAVLTINGKQRILRKGQRSPEGVLLVSSTLSHVVIRHSGTCLLYTSPSPRDQRGSRMPSSA